MKAIKTLASAIVIGSAILATVPSYAADCPVTNVKFKKGASSASYNGKIKGWQCRTYAFYAKAGQTLTFNLNTKGAAEAIIYGNDDFVQNEPYTLPKTGRYEVRVLQPKAQSIKNLTSRYKVNIQIK
ncbi:MULTISPECIES: hypothetical protein [unclassified Avibacterium]|uniref:hypothetical protein n=1 Tax=unclassified Avibacterium TaxID=2685287 RepID=UPI002026DFB8|nr:MULTISPECIES: hypothetical protein [unclassified Avibacterium]URL01978.1 hypothetical protein L4F91_10930 [Avibacterium sp. 20-126]MCW9699137.1 hypothetical protein [Avibacterium sp. 20-129]MCW9718809.1 hypothetical protein [Avibacterium sp. 21-599]MCW9732992.1 hypothetical protein [Avibacterium sp. 20-15]URL05122.1 hypothetical protein L4F93_04430 [Avibacterium sp. 20-132]